MRLPHSKGEQHLTSWGWRVDIYIPCIPEPLFSNIHFSGSQQLCFWGAQKELFRSLYQVIWNGASSLVWMTPCRKCVEYICLVKGGSRWAGESFPHSHLPSYCLHRSAGKRVEGKQLEWCQHLGLWAALCSRSLGSFCIRLLWSCQQVKHSAVFLRAAEIWCALSPPLAELAWPCLAPCLGWDRLNPLGSPNGSPRLGQAWGAVLLHLARGEKPHQLLAIAKTLSTDFASTTDSHGSQT